MGRQIKEGLDYFDLSCQMDDKIKLIQAEFGLKGFAVVVKLYQKIYGGHGYFCEWNEDVLLLFMSENGLSSDDRNLIEEIVKACIRRNLFSAEHYDRYQILTSSGIQKRYLNAVAKRVGVKLIREYLLVNVDQNSISADINAISDGRNRENDGRNPQSREEKSREEKSKGSSAAPLRRTTAEKMVDEMGYPPEVSEAVKDWMKYKIEKRQSYKETGFRNLLKQVEKNVREYGADPVVNAIRQSMSSNYQGIVWDKVRNASRVKQAQRTNNRFNNFQGRDYDYEALERQLLDAQRRGGA